jgi:hypothetical protein
MRAARSSMKARAVPGVRSPIMKAGMSFVLASMAVKVQTSPMPNWPYSVRVPSRLGHSAM